MQKDKEKNIYTNKEILECIEKIKNEYNVPIKNKTEDYFSPTRIGENKKNTICEAEQLKSYEILDQLQEYVKKQNEEFLYKSYSENDEKVRYSILDVLELDRKRIARDLHDSSVQLMTMLVHKAELCEKLIDLDTIRTKIELRTIIDVLKDTIFEMRQTIFDLRPMTIDDLGLVDSLKRYVQILVESSEVVFKIIMDEKTLLELEERIESVVKLSIYRIVQESCSNIIKHARAKEAIISIGVKDEAINLEIRDDGIGLPYASETAVNDSKSYEEILKLIQTRNDKTGYGLCMLCERVFLLKGDIKITSIKNQGTSIKVCIPLHTKEECIGEAD